jgi:hypothetical protein
MSACRHGKHEFVTMMAVERDGLRTLTMSGEQNESFNGGAPGSRPVDAVVLGRE